MAGRVGGWVARGSASNAIATAAKAAPPNSAGQHVIYSLDISFLAAPSAPVLWEIIAASTSPGTVLASGYSTGVRPITFPEGLCVPIGQAVAAILAAAETTGVLNLHGVTR